MTSRKGWHRKYGNYIYDGQDNVVVICEAPSKTGEAWDAAFKAADDIVRWAKLDGREIRGMLYAMQAGEMTVSRGIELLDLWLAGNYSDELLPPVDRDLVPEDKTPIEMINELQTRLDTLG